MAKVVLDWKTANDFIRDAFIGVGVPADEAEIVTDVILESDRDKLYKGWLRAVERSKGWEEE